MKRKRFIFPFLLLLLFSCQKEIVIKTLPYNPQLSIECILHPGKVPQLFLFTSLPYFNSNSTPQQLFARNASVTISSSSGTDQLAADSTFDNFRCRWLPFYKGSIVAQVGQTYTLTVTYGGKTYTASTTIDQSPAQIQSVSYTPHFQDIYGDHEGVIVDFADHAGSENYYRYEMNRMIDSSVYGTSNLGLIHSTCAGSTFLVQELGRAIYSDKNLDGQSITIAVEPAYEHQQDDSAYVMIQSLDKNAAEFFDNLDKQMQAQMNPFVEPVFLKTKIEGCIGVFGSAVISDSLLFIYPE